MSKGINRNRKRKEIMENEFLPYEQALALKELGFDKPCLKVGNPNGHTMWKWIEVDGEPPTVNINDVIQVHYDENWAQIPTFSQAFRWFREKYGLDSFVKHLYKSTIKVGYYFVIDEYKGIEFQSEIFSTPEEAELTCLVKLIEIAKVK